MNLNNGAGKDRNVATLIIALLAFFVIALLFCPGINQSVTEDMNALLNGAMDEGSMDALTHTIFDIDVYGNSVEILGMLLLGFGFLMCFIRDHGFSSLTGTLLVVSISIPVYMLLKNFVEGESLLDMNCILFGEFAAASLLIAMGAPLGKLKMDQYMVLALLFTPVYFINELVILESGLFEGFLDTGGSVVIHAFGAYFGLGLVCGTRKKFDGLQECETDYTHNMFCLLGSLVLWVFWPSFTSAVASPERIVLTAINTVLALCASTLATYCMTKLVRGKINIEDIANAALAGGVAIGSSCDVCSPGYAMIIGLLAGILSTLGFSIIAPKVCNLIRGDDTCGVHNLHGMPGLLGGIMAMFITGNIGVQLGAMVCNIVIAFVGGKIVGWIVFAMGRKSVPFKDEGEFEEE